MPEVNISIGGREFEVACQEGEKKFLEAAAAMLDAEAATLSDQMGRMPESRMLLMSGLMLADRMAGVDEQIRTLQEKVASQEALIEELNARPAQKVEVPVIPSTVKDSIAELAARAESLAEAMEEAIQQDS
ncbi:cell division protein ZapA [Qingshengfaniella alkalisoli]|uniref:Cell division protein ZapA n=1 Tax=Qingshengfaniella alkalisoli TaxID=2599296 RepID=A0A5B8IV44_9RHOB|nr:cell division protein ZapA [Qingshengfaniella alkalisoli]QDY68731.1 cell division protein ZapA [Qingshengfaniella alkalisoli]